MSPVVVQIGNQGAPHATEAAYRDGYQAAGCTVVGIDQAEAYERGPAWFLDQCSREWHPDLVVYSRTHNNTALGPDWTAVWTQLALYEVKTAGVHLDVYWGLPEREEWIRSGDAQFTVGTLFTADGGSDEKWKAAGVNHVWLPPGADTRFIPEHAEPFPELAGKVVFVGSSMGYHPSYPGRQDLIDHARSTYGSRFVEIGNGTAWGPKRGEDLARVYASDCICIGDSCFAGQRANYWSDRIPETLGRGGLLVHTEVPGLRQMYDGSVLGCFEAGDYDELDNRVEYYWAASAVSEYMRDNARKLVMGRDTYRHRAAEVLDIMEIGQ